MDNNINNINNEENIILALNYAKNILNNLHKPNIKKHLKKSLNLLKNLNQTEEVMVLLSQTEIEYNKKKSNIFKLIKTNNINKIKKINNIDFNEINKNGNTVLHHCIRIGDSEILKLLLKKGGNINSVNGNGHTLLEYACLCKDPNIINTVLLLGADMKKHLFFRKGSDKYYLNKSDIDMAILMKLLIHKFLNNEKKNLVNFSFLLEYFNSNELIGIEKFTISDLLIGLEYLFDGKKCFDTYKNIVIEELNYYNYCAKNNIYSCYNSKVDIILLHIVPFINYPFNISSEFLLKKEIFILIKHIIKNNKKNYKNLIVNNIFSNYIDTNIQKEDYLGIIVFKILKDLKI